VEAFGAVVLRAAQGQVGVARMQRDRGKLGDTEGGQERTSRVVAVERNPGLRIRVVVKAEDAAVITREIVIVRVEDAGMVIGMRPGAADGADAGPGEAAVTRDEWRAGGAGHDRFVWIDRADGNHVVVIALGIEEIADARLSGIQDALPVGAAIARLVD